MSTKYRIIYKQGTTSWWWMVQEKRIFGWRTLELEVSQSAALSWLKRLLENRGKTINLWSE